MLKVMTVVGTRPEIIKMSRVIDIFDRFTTHTLVHTGQNYDFELNQIFFDDLGIRKPDHFLEAQAERTAQTIANVIAKTDELLEKVKPDAFMIYGDTNSCLSAIAAKRRKVPIFHMEAGNRCFDQRVPEEINRKIVDHMSDINMVLSEHARRYLIAEGIPQDRIIKTGSHIPEILEFYGDKIQNSAILKTLNLTPQSYLTLSLHREENVDIIENIDNLVDILGAIVQKYNKRLIVSLHPRTRKRLEGITNFDKRVEFNKPFAFTDYITLQKNAFCVLSDSGTITEESSLLNVPAVNLRNAHERPEGMDGGVVIMSPLNAERILSAIDASFAQTQRSIPDYSDTNISNKVLQIVMSYVDFINRVVWGKK